jgi:hypothetical protein
MTIGAAWVRRSREGAELWFASDSRLSGDGWIWDDCPKLFVLPRRDAVAAFSGSTEQAYPLLWQVTNSIAAYEGAASGVLEFSVMVNHLERVVNSLLGRLRLDPLVRGGTPTGRLFSTRGDAIMLGGYSRRGNTFRVRRLIYDKRSRAWRFARVRPTDILGKNRVIRIFGDRRSQSRYSYLLKRLLEERGTLANDDPFDLEPLAVLSGFLRFPESAEARLPLDRRPHTIGGAPQIVRVLLGAQATPYAVRWRDDRGEGTFLAGRRCLDYERLDVPLATFDNTVVELHAMRQWGYGAEQPASSPVPAEEMRDELIRSMLTCLRAIESNRGAGK